MIPKAEQTKIKTTIRALCEGMGDQGEQEERQQLLFTGVLVALGTTALPPHWVINIQCHRTDRIMAEKD